MISYSQFQQAVENACALRRVSRLQPITGVGEMVYPPTYIPKKGTKLPRYCYGRQIVDESGNEVAVAVLDSVQSQAKRLSRALLTGARTGAFKLPYLEVDLSASGAEPQRLSSLELSHRLFDPYLRASQINGVRFVETELGLRVHAASPMDAAAILAVEPMTLLLGSWDSRGRQVGSKFRRCMVSAIDAVGVPVDVVDPGHAGALPEMITAARHTVSQSDPLNLSSRIQVFKVNDGRDWVLTAEEAGTDAISVPPSKVHLSARPPDIEPRGSTMQHARHRLGIPFASLRQLHFGNQQENEVARTYLAALGLLAAHEQDAQGYSLRSRCDLVRESPTPWQLLDCDGNAESLELDRAGARALYAEAWTQACAYFPMQGVTELQAQPKLIELIQRNRLLNFAADEGDE